MERRSRSVLSRLLWLLSTCLLAVKGSSFEFRDFIAKNRLIDGELETRIRLRGVTAKETTVSGGNNTGITFRQLTDGRHFIQLIYDSSMALRDCEYMDNDPKQVQKFLTAFNNELGLLEVEGKEISLVGLGETLGNEVPIDVQRWMKYGKLRHRCRKVQMKLRKEVEFRRQNEEAEEGGADDKSHGRHTRSITYVAATTKRILGGLRRGLQFRFKQMFIYPGMQWCGISDRAHKYTDVGEDMGTDMCCRKHDLCRFAIPGNDRRYRMYNSSPLTKTHCQCDRSGYASGRSKRDLSDLFRMPDTKWCGKGYSATMYTQLGGFTGPDRCCRLHDTACPFWIAGFQNKYGLFNWRVNTLMHCSCDRRFRTCLKMADTSASNLIGKIFFNVVQTKCFVLKPKRVCIRRSWWGKKCLKWKVTKKAILKDNMPF